MKAKLDTINLTTKSLTAFGTYGFLSLLVATQVASADPSPASKSTVKAQRSGKKNSRIQKKVSKRNPALFY